MRMPVTITQEHEIAAKVRELQQTLARCRTLGRKATGADTIKAT
jgi:hypothetical protein